ncbi:NHL repeat-containing protein [Paraflavisolibacter sp. H34]|uniref:NHL repeat-containing protein n=1 Tax=Huijunlia imazamoxiresistens TaxID=3127457 RepID=UPI003017B8EF
MKYSLFPSFLAALIAAALCISSCNKEGGDPDDGGNLIKGLVRDTLAGYDSAGFRDAAGKSARFFFPCEAVVDPGGNVIVADEGNDCIRRITPAGEVSTLAGSLEHGWGVISWGFRDGKGTAARFNAPQDVALDAAGNLYVADGENHSIRKITPDGTVNTIAGNGEAGYTDGRADTARFFMPTALAVDWQGTIYVVERFRHRVRKIAGGMVTTLAGTGEAGLKDGAGKEARFYQPRQVAVDGDGNLFLADGDNRCIRKITPAGEVTTLAGGSGSGLADGKGQAARFIQPEGLAIDSRGNLYVGDDGYLRKVTAAGEVSTLEVEDFAGEPALFRYATGVTMDAKGNLFGVERNDHYVWKLKRK